jgi:hypothetical protein
MLLRQIGRASQRRENYKLSTTAQPCSWPDEQCIYANVFSWDHSKAIVNFEKHGISFEEAANGFC